MDLEPEKRMATAILKLEADPVLKKPQYSLVRGHDAFCEMVVAAKLYLGQGGVYAPRGSGQRRDGGGHAKPGGGRDSS